MAMEEMRHPGRRRALAALLLACGLLSRASGIVVPPAPIVAAQGIETVAPSWTAQIIATAPPATRPPLTIGATPAPAPSGGEADAEGVEFTFAVDLPAQEAAQPTRTPLPLEEAEYVPIPMPSSGIPTLPPTGYGYAPDYEYATDSVRIAINRRELPGVVYFAVELWLTDIRQLQSAFSGDRFDAATEPVSDIAARNNAILAINGDFATFNNGGIIIRNGSVYRTNDSTRQLLVIDAQGNFIPYETPPEDPVAAASGFHMLGAWHTLVFGPVLVKNAQATALPEKFFVSTGAVLEPRTAIAQLGPLHYLILVVDGRQDGYSEGISLPRLQELFLEYGAITAFNLDGGGSTTLYFDGEVLNQPGNGGQRHVPDILFVQRGA